MTGGGLAGLIAAVETALRAGLKAVRAFAGTLRPRGLARPQAAPAAHFGEQEELEESKYYPPAPFCTMKLEGELPDSYGKTRVLMLVVDPNLVHAHWEVTPDKLREAKSQMEGSSQPVLRFYDATGCFDVDVDLGSRNWYVPLWSAGESYYADLGLRGEDGSFVQLARSNVVLTPRALPIVEVEERFMRVAAPGRRAEIVPPPPYRKPRRPHAPVSPEVPAGAGPSGADLAEVPTSPSAPARAAAGFAKPIDSAEILTRKLAAFYALREWHHEPLKPEEAAPVRGPGSPWPEERYPDLTELAEKQQTMGLSSALLQGGRPQR